MVTFPLYSCSLEDEDGSCFLCATDVFTSWECMEKGGQRFGTVAELKHYLREVGITLTLRQGASLPGVGDQEPTYPVRVPTTTEGMSSGRKRPIQG